MNYCRHNVIDLCSDNENNGSSTCSDFDIPVVVIPKKRRKEFNCSRDSSITITDSSCCSDNKEGECVDCGVDDGAHGGGVSISGCVSGSGGNGKDLKNQFVHSNNKQHTLHADNLSIINNEHKMDEKIITDEVPLSPEIKNYRKSLSTRLINIDNSVRDKFNVNRSRNNSTLSNNSFNTVDFLLRGKEYFESMKACDIKPWDSCIVNRNYRKNLIKPMVVDLYYSQLNTLLDQKFEENNSYTLDARKMQKTSVEEEDRYENVFGAATTSVKGFTTSTPKKKKTTTTTASISRAGVVEVEFEEELMEEDKDESKPLSECSNYSDNGLDESEDDLLKILLTPRIYKK